MTNYYPLTAAQKMHHNWIMDYGTQQVSGVSVVASVQAELDFGLLKKCIQMETERSGCTRIHFTKPDKDGNVQQYLVQQDPRDIGFKNLSGMGSLAKADELMQQWAYETFDGDDIPMCEFTMLKLPEGYNGFFVHMDHRLIDSCGLVVMIGDLFQLYTYYKYGTAYPQELADFEAVLKKDLAKAGNEKRFAKDKKFWDDQLDTLGEPLYSDIQGPSVLEEARRRHGNPKLRSSDIEMKDLFENMLTMLHHYVTETTSNSRPARHTKEEVSYVITCAIGSTIGVLHKWSRDNFNLAPEVIADILSEIFLSGMLPLLS